MSEQEQIALAIGNSLREIKTANDDNDDDSSLDEDDSDYENFDDESSNQSFAKPPMSQVTSAASNFNNGAMSEIVECDTNNIGSTTDESYEDYLGDENGNDSVHLLNRNLHHSSMILPFNFIYPKQPKQIQKHEYSCGYQMVIST